MGLSVAGLRVPFKSKTVQAPNLTRLSKRVGLRTIASISVKTPCPKGEQITNGGFETGDFTEWSTANVGPGRGEVIGDAAYEGRYFCRLYDQSWGSPSPTIWQNFRNPVPYKCLRVTSTFSVALRPRPLWSPPVLGMVKINIIYTDETYTDVFIEPREPEWRVYDLKELVEIDKTLKAIKLFYPSAGTDGWIDIDAVKLIP